MQYTRAFLIMLAVYLLCSPRLYAQDIRIIQLKNERAAYSPKTFYISAVADSTHDSTGIGVINDSGKIQYIVLQDGTATAIKSYIDNNITETKTGEPVGIRINKLEANVKKKGAKWVVKTSVTFVFFEDGIGLDLTQTSNDLGETNGDPANYLENQIRKLLAGELEQFEKWWVHNKDKYATSSKVKVNVVLNKKTDDHNLIVYSRQRPLRQNDFKGKVRIDDSEKAVTSSGNSFTQSGSIENGQTVVEFVITPYFDKSESWFNPENTNPYLLAHEQAHFDITAIKTCELIIALRKASFTKDNYAAASEQMRKQYLEETNAEQDAYDTETDHGTIPEKQQAWQDKISREVKAVGCY